MEEGISRFVPMHRSYYRQALEEIRGGRKTSHWMWFIFPQIRGLGHSPISVRYAIRDLEEAAAFLKDPYLGGNLREISEALLELDTNDPVSVFAWDDVKLRSSMTLFALVSEERDSVFQKVLDKYFDGQSDDRTLRILGIG